MFERGRIYHRVIELHEAHGGQRFGGISTPNGSRMLLLFTGDEGLAFGYEDGWQNDGLFHYCGEGQVGPQTFTKGNKAIRDHAINGKELHLFEKIADTQYRYEGEFVYSGDHPAEGKDRNGDTRPVIMFELLPLATLDEFLDVAEQVDEELQSATMEQLRALAISGGSLAGAVSRTTLVRRRSAAVAKYARLRAGGVCEGCLTPGPFLTKAGEPFLEVHHLRRLSDGGPDHPRWVAAICPNCHRRVHHASDGVEFNDEVASRIGLMESTQVIV